jgi:hypothetical protein
MMFYHFLMMTSALIGRSASHLFAQLKENFFLLSSVLTIQEINVRFDKFQESLILNWSPFIRVALILIERS